MTSRSPDRTARRRLPPRRAHLTSRRYGLRTSPLAPRIDELFARLDRPGQPGGMIAVLRGGHVIHQAAYGVADVENDLPFHAGSVLRLGSTTKHLAATAILLLEDRGLLALDDDVRRHLPEVPDLGVTITLRHLLTMTSGIPDGLSRQLFAGHSARHPITQQSLVDLFLRGRQLIFQPGEQCSYSNTNYSLLTLVLERLTGTTLREFLRRELFTPFGMTATDLVADAREVVSGLATGYEPAEASAPIGDTVAGAPTRSFFPVELAADGGVNATLDDLVGWLQHLRASDGPVARWRERLETEGVLTNGERTGYGLGFSVDEYRGLRKVGHGGGMPGYLCDLVLFEDPGGRLRDDIGFVALWNWLDPTLFESAAKIVDLVLDSGPWGLGSGGAEGVATPAVATTMTTATVAATHDDGTATTAPAGLYACFETGELLHVLERDGQTLGFYLGEPTPLVRDADGMLRGAKRGLGFSLEPAANGVLDARFGASPPRAFRSIAAPASLGTRFALSPGVPLSSDDLSDAQATDRLDAYAGRYRSNELGEEVIVTVAGPGHGLAIRLASPLRRLLWSELRRLEDDLFYAVIPGCPTATNVSALFRRDRAGHVTTLVQQTSRAGAVSFERREDSARG